MNGLIKYGGFIIIFYFGGCYFNLKCYLLYLNKCNSILFLFFYIYDLFIVNYFFY